MIRLLEGQWRMVSPDNLTDTSEVVRLVESVEQLGDADQHRILRIVILLTRVPASVRQRTHGMLRELLEAVPDSADLSSHAVDEIISFLENEVIARHGPACIFDRYELVTGLDWRH